MFILIFFSLIGNSLEPLESKESEALNMLRLSFHESIIDETKIDDFYTLTNTVNSTDAVLRSYKAAGHVMKAKTAWNPVEKLKLVFKYQNTIGEIIKEYPMNVEVRFLRFSIAYYLPDMLGFKKNMQVDKEVMMLNLDQFEVTNLDPMFNRFILWFVNECGYYNTDEIQEIKCRLS